MQIRTHELLVEAVFYVHSGHCISQGLSHASLVLLANVLAAFVGLACICIPYVEVHQLMVKQGLVVAAFDVLSLCVDNLSGNGLSSQFTLKAVKVLPQNERILLHLTLSFKDIVQNIDPVPLIKFLILQKSLSHSHYFPPQPQTQTGIADESKSTMSELKSFTLHLHNDSFDVIFLKRGRFGKVDELLGRRDVEAIKAVEGVVEGTEGSRKKSLFMFGLHLWSVIILEDRLCHSVPEFITSRHLPTFPYTFKVTKALLRMAFEQGESLVVANRFDVAAVVEGEKMELSILYSCACFDEESLGLVKVVESNDRSVELEVHKRIVVIDKGANDISDDFGCRHLLKFFSKGSKVHQMEAFLIFPAVKGSKSLMEPPQQYQIYLVVFIENIFPPTGPCQKIFPQFIIQFQIGK